MTPDARNDPSEAGWRKATSRRRRRRAIGASAALALWAIAAQAQALPTPRLPALTADARDAREAQEIAKTVWKRVLVRCGHDRVFALESRKQRPMQFRKANFRFESTTDRLTPAQRANGMEWQGGFYINSPLFRTYAGDERAEGASAVWQPWQDNFTDSIQAGFDLRKFRGQWLIREFNGEAFTPFSPAALSVKSVSCGAPEPSFGG